MKKPEMPDELHRSSQIGWLRAAVLGANDGLVSVSCLIIGVAAAHSSRQSILLGGVAGLVAGTMSMAAGEYVSTSSQTDSIAADLHREREELATNIEFEQEELAEIYVGRGLDYGLAREVAGQLMAHDALGSHAREELGINHLQTVYPLQAAMASAGSYCIGGGLPLVLALLSPAKNTIVIVAVGSIFLLLCLGTVSAYVGRAPLLKAAVRVGFWGVIAMGVTAGVGFLFGAVV